MFAQVMEVGEIDLNSLLADHLGKRISMNFIRYIWEQVCPLLYVLSASKLLI